MNNSHERTQGKHNEALRQITGDPRLVGLVNIIKIEAELPFFRGVMQQGQADLVLHEEDRVHVVEYKCNDCSTARTKAYHQLLRAERFLLENFGYNTDQLLYVYADFNTEQLVNGIWIPR